MHGQISTQSIPELVCVVINEMPIDITIAYMEAIENMDLILSNVNQIFRLFLVWSQHYLVQVCVSVMLLSLLQVRFKYLQIIIHLILSLVSI